MSKYWVKNYFAHGRFPKVGQKQKTEKKERVKVMKVELNTIGPGGFAYATQGGVAMRSWPLLLPSFGLSLSPLSFLFSPSFAFDPLRGISPG